MQARPTLDVTDVAGTTWKLKGISDVDTGEYLIKDFLACRKQTLSVQVHSYLNSEAVSKTFGSLFQRLPIDLTFFPMKEGSYFLVPSTIYRNSIVIDWTNGSRVMKIPMRRFLQQGTVTSVWQNFWNSVTFHWDEANTAHASSPWDLILVWQQPQPQHQPLQTLQLFPH